MCFSVFHINWYSCSSFHFFRFPVSENVADYVRRNTNKSYMNYEIFGWLGSFFYAVCFLPQIYGIYKKESPELSIIFMYFQLGGSTSMFVYGVLKLLYPIIVLNGFAWLCMDFQGFSRIF